MSGDPGKLDFEKISKDLGKLEQKQHVNQIASTLTHTYFTHSKYTDKEGVEQYKEKFKQKDAEKLVNDLFDKIVYHAHRRLFKIDDEKYKELLKMKDAQGNPYCDVVAEAYFPEMKRGDMRRQFAGKKQNEITLQGIQQYLNPRMQRHANLLRTKVIEKNGLDEPKHQGSLKSAIEKIVDKYDLPKDKYSTKEMTDPREILDTYVSLSTQFYGE